MGTDSGSHGSFRLIASLFSFFIPAVAVWPAGGQRVLPHEIRRAIGVAHGVVQPAHGGCQVGKAVTIMDFVAYGGAAL